MSRLIIMLSQPNLAKVGVGAELGNTRWSHMICHYLKNSRSVLDNPNLDIRQLFLMVPKRAFMLPKKTFRTFRKFEVVLLGSLNYEIFYCLFRKDLHVFLGSCNVENKG